MLISLFTSSSTSHSPLFHLNIFFVFLTLLIRILHLNLPQEFLEISTHNIHKTYLTLRIAPYRRSTRPFSQCLFSSLDGVL